MLTFKFIKTRYQIKYNTIWLGPVLKKLEWAQQPLVEEEMGCLQQKTYLISKPYHMLVFKSSMYNTSEAISSGTITLKMTAILLTKFSQILTKFSQVLTIYCKNHQMHVKQIQGRNFLRKKAPVGMPTHRTGVDNIKNPLKIIKIN